MKYVKLMKEQYEQGAIEGVAMPRELMLSIKKRGMTSPNFRFCIEDKTVEVKCSKCAKWFKVLQLENGEWKDINGGVYKTTHDKKEDVDTYFAKCTGCYEKGLKNGKKTDENGEEKISQPKVDWSKHGDGKQRTVFFTQEVDNFLRFKGAEMDMRLNELINLIVTDWKNENPVDKDII